MAIFADSHSPRASMDRRATSIELGEDDDEALPSPRWVSTWSRPP